VCVDLDLCQGHGVCVAEAPEVFELDPDERKAILRTEVPDAEQRARVELAVRHCPTHALSIEE
jgi:ferredoxin